MTEPVPIRAVERQRITRPHEVIETERVVEFAARVDSSTRAALPSAEPPRCTCVLCESGMQRTSSAAARQALPPGPPTRPWWRRWLS